jgi:hypothetical protein
MSNVKRNIFATLGLVWLTLTIVVGDSESARAVAGSAIENAGGAGGSSSQTLIAPTTGTQAIAATTDTLSAAYSTLVITALPATQTVMSSAPTITAGTAGQYLTICNAVSGKTLTLKDETHLTGGLLLFPNNQDVALGFAECVSMVYVSTAAHWIGTSRWPPPGSLLTAYDYDWTALPTLNLKTLGDTPQSIGDGYGSVWTPTGTAGASTFGFTNGTGLVMTSAAAASKSLVTPLASIAPFALPGQTELFYWINVSFVAPAASPNWHYISLVNMTTANLFDFLLGRRNQTGTQEFDAYLDYAGANVVTPPVAATMTNLTNDVWLIRVDSNGTLLTAYTGNYSSGWPALSSMTQRWVYQRVSAAGTGGTQNNVSNLAAGLDIVMATDSLSLTVKRVRIQYR